jgi:hypothetical protein
MHQRSRDTNTHCGISKVPKISLSETEHPIYQLYVIIKFKLTLKFRGNRWSTNVWIKYSKSHKKCLKEEKKHPTEMFSLPFMTIGWNDETDDLTSCWGWVGCSVCVRSAWGWEDLLLGSGVLGNVWQPARGEKMPSFIAFTDFWSINKYSHCC